MIKIRKFLLISFGGLIALMVLGMLFTVITGTRPEEVSEMNLIVEWKWYRVVLYVLVVICWPWIARLSTQPHASAADQSDNDREKLLHKHEKDYRYMKSQWWKIALLLLFVEVVIIRQFGLGG